MADPYRSLDIRPSSTGGRIGASADEFPELPGVVELVAEADSAGGHDDRGLWKASGGL